MYGGKVDRVGKDGPRVNPFALEPTESNIKFLYSFVKLLLTKGSAELEPEDDDVIHKAVQDMYLLDPANRRLSNLFLPKKLDRYLSKWIGKGADNAVFDSVEDGLWLSRLQCFDFQGVNNKQYTDLIEPLMIWLLRGINNVLYNPANLGVLKYILIEEIFSSMEKQAAPGWCARFNQNRPEESWRSNHDRSVHMECPIFSAVGRVSDGSDDGDGTNFHGQKRSNKTHESTTDADARLYKKSYGKESKLSYLGHALVENRNGLIAAAMVTHADGYAERDAALLMLAEKQEGRSRRITVGADKAYDTKDFISTVRELNVTPHVTKNDKGRRSNLDRRTTRQPGYAISLSRRWLVEKGFGWLKQTGPLRQVKLRGLEKVDWLFVFSCAAHNLIRLPRLMAQSQERLREQCA